MARGRKARARQQARRRAAAVAGRPAPQQPPHKAPGKPPPAAFPRPAATGAVPARTVLPEPQVSEPGLLDRRRPALDGLRGVAVVAVLLFHGGVGWARGGFLGVDVFFVLSGFLVTVLLLEEARRGGRVRLGAFWGRRARRLAPALLLLLGALLVVPGFAGDADLATLRGDVVATLAYVANWRFLAADAGYFDGYAAPSPLQHTWSLAIEEQFYLLWPLVVAWAVRRHWRRSSLVRLAAGGAATSAVLMVFAAVGGGLDRAYYATDTRAQAVLAGACLGIALTGRRPDRPPAASGRSVAGVLAAAVLLVLVVTADGHAAWLYRGGFTLVAVATVVVVHAVVTRPRAPLARLLGGWPLVAAGRLSYGLYLWHWPVYLLLTNERTGLRGLPLLTTRLVVTVALAVLSWLVVERPALSGALPGWPGRATLASGLAALAAVALFTGPAPVPEPVASPANQVDEVAAEEPLDPVPGVPVASAEPEPDETATPVPSLPPGQTLRVAVLGDSVAYTLAQGLSAPAREWNVRVSNHGTLGCGVVKLSTYRYVGAVQTQPASCREWPTRWRSAVRRSRADVALVIVGRWEVMDRRYDGEWTRLGEPAYDEYVERQLEQAVDVLADAGVRVALATAPYYRRGEQPDGSLWPEDEPERVDTVNTIVRRVAARHPETVTVVQLGERLSPGGYSKVVDGVKVRTDGVHVSVAGARWLAPWLVPQLIAAAGA